MKRFWLFTGNHYYPDGGMNDFKGDFASREEAVACCLQLRYHGKDRPEWAHIWDTEIREMEWINVVTGEKI